MPFARGLPLAKALHPDTLLAFRMNGEPLTRSHGAPVRLIVPGWYGVCSVKWIKRLEVLDGMFSGYFQSNKYTIRRREDAGERKVPLTRMVVKSEIIRPGPDVVMASTIATEDSGSHVLLKELSPYGRKRTVQRFDGFIDVVL